MRIKGVAIKTKYLDYTIELDKCDTKHIGEIIDFGCKLIQAEGYAHNIDKSTLSEKELVIYNILFSK